MGGTTQATCYKCHEEDDCVYDGEGWLCGECEAKLNPHGIPLIKEEVCVPRDTKCGKSFECVVCPYVGDCDINRINERNKEWRRWIDEADIATVVMREMNAFTYSDYVGVKTGDIEKEYGKRIATAIKSFLKGESQNGVGVE